MNYKYILRECEHCHATYATGREYGNYWIDWQFKGIEKKGLCEFCNKNTIWYVEIRKFIKFILNLF